MSLNGRIALAAAFTLLLAPLWLPLLPFAWLWWRRLRKLGRAQGLQVLNALQARAIVAQAEATMPTPPVDGWFAVARQVDRYLALVDSPRRWRSLAVLTSLEFAPCLRLQTLLSRQAIGKRRTFLERHLATTQGLLAIPALARQLVRMGYYANADIAKRLGFATMQERQPQSGRPQAAPVDDKAVG